MLLPKKHPNLAAGFNLSQMTPEELKEYFDNNPPPFEIEWKPWAKVINSKHFLEACYTAIEHYKGHYLNCPDYWHLLELHKDIIGNKADNE